MVDGFRENLNIRIKAQIKPGLEYIKGQIMKAKINSLAFFQL